MGRIFDVVQKYRVERARPDEPAGIHLLQRDLPEDPRSSGGSSRRPAAPRGRPTSRHGFDPAGRGPAAATTARPPSAATPARLAPGPPQRGSRTGSRHPRPRPSPSNAWADGTGRIRCRQTRRSTRPDHGPAQILRRFKDLRTAYVKRERRRGPGYARPGRPKR